MNLPRLKKWSERQQVLATILMAGALMFALWFFLLAPVNSRRNRLENEIEAMRAQLAARNYLLGEDVLRKKVQSEEQYERALQREWTSTVARISAFPNPETEDAMQVGHIDFKVALFDVRRRLQRKSRDLNISLPHNLGMDDAVTSSEDARKLMLQLRTVEKLVDLTLDMKIDKLRDITPMEPVPRGLSNAAAPFFEEYPVEVQFYGDIESVFDLFRATLKPAQTLALRRLRVESVARDKPGLLSVDAVLSGLVFLQSPEQVQRAMDPAPVARRRSVPLGH